MTALKHLIKLEKQARAFGFNWPDALMILDQSIDECREIREAIEEKLGQDKLQEEIGDL